MFLFREKRDAQLLKYTELKIVNDNLVCRRKMYEPIDEMMLFWFYMRSHCDELRKAANGLEEVARCEDQIQLNTAHEKSNEKTLGALTIFAGYQCVFTQLCSI